MDAGHAIGGFSYRVYGGLSGNPALSSLLDEPLIAWPGNATLLDSAALLMAHSSDDIVACCDHGTGGNRNDDRLGGGARWQSSTWTC